MFVLIEKRDEKLWQNLFYFVIIFLVHNRIIKQKGEKYGDFY